VIFVYATIVDEDGISVHEAKMPVHFSIIGEAKLVGENPVWSEAGIATILLKAGSKKGQLTIEARSEGLDEASLILTVR
jgi:beta-galactosidase